MDGTLPYAGHGKRRGETPIELTQDNYKSYLKDSGQYNKFYLPSGSYILMGDITLDDALLIGYNEQFDDVNVILDLNGYVLQQGSKQGVPVIDVFQGSTLIIQDSRPEVPHKFKADSTGLWQLDEENGDKTVNGGVITGSTRTGLVIESRSRNQPDYIAQCTMNGGTISDCVSATADGGDALHMTYAGMDVNSSFSMSAEARINGSLKDDNLGASEGSAGVYTITFDSDGGTEVPPQVRPQGAAAVKPADPSKNDWDFGGWYIGETAYDFTQPVTLGFRALSMSGGSVLHGKVTGADDSSYFTMGDDARIDGDIDVGDSRVDGKVICTGNIISGVFNDEVVNNGRITGGIF